MIPVMHGKSVTHRSTWLLFPISGLFRGRQHEMTRRNVLFYSYCQSLWLFIFTMFAIGSHSPKTFILVWKGSFLLSDFVRAVKMTRCYCHWIWLNDHKYPRITYLTSSLHHLFCFLQQNVFIQRQLISGRDTKNPQGSVLFIENPVLFVQICGEVYYFEQNNAIGLKYWETLNC